MELIESLRSLELGNSELLLATRHVDGKLVEDPKEVHLREIAVIEIDDDDRELKFLPRTIAGEDHPSVPVFSLSYLESFREANSHLQDYQVFDVDRRGLLDDGGVGETGQGFYEE